LEEEFMKVSKELYEILIPKDISKKTILLTDGRLSTIPFEALINPKSGQYLIAETEVAYDFSASLFLAKNNEDFSYENEALLIAPITFNEFSNSFKNLPATESEINEIKYQFISKNIESQVYLKSQANEKVLGEIENRSYKYVHLATHGVVETDNPDLSRIYLYPDSE
jgi:CHAT domain-containing protein